MSELDGVKTKKKKSSSSKSQDDKVKKKKSSGEKKKKKKRGDDEATNALAEDEHDLHDPGGHVEEIKPVTNAEAIRATLNFKPTGDHFVIGHDGQIPFGLDRAGFETLEVERIRDAVTQDDLDWLDLGSEIKTVDGRTAVGLASCTSDDGKELMGIALSTHRKALYIECRDWLPEDVKRYSSALMAFLHSADILCVGLDLALTVLAIRRHLNIDSCGVDVCSATPMEAKSPAGTAEALFKSLPGITRLFQYTWKGPDVPPRRPGEEPPPPEEPEVDDDYSAGYGALRAWLALTCAVHTRRWLHVQQARELDTRRVGLQQISFFLDSYHVQARLEALKPRTAVADMAADSFRTDSKGQLDLLNAKFSSKVRVDANQTLKLTLSDGRVVEHASALATKGRHTIIKGNEKGVEVVSVEVQGRASGTLADMMWRVYMRQALSGTIDVHDSDIINEIFWTNTRRGHARRMAKARELLADKTPPPIPEEPEPAPSPADDAPPKVAEVAEDKAPEETKEPAEETVEKAKEDDPGSTADEVPSQTGESQMPEEEEESQTDLVTKNEPAPAVPIEEAGPPTSHATQRLNPAQRKAHDAICGGELPVCLIQGPPGTGKTSVISAAVQTWLLRNDAPKCIFVCAKNNVASQNIADSLKDTGFEDFRLIVSSDFYIDWHEHRYSLKKQLVISNQLGTKVEPEEIEELMGGVRVVICTLAMLSSHNLMENGFFQSYRPYSLLIDEASQIRSDELPFALDRFKRSLQNVAFFGDNKQLAPYHAAQVRAIKSIFDMAHLQPYTIFLNIQYRLPSRVGDFISTYVYGSNLRSAANTSANRDCVKFVDVPEGEEEKSGTSTINRKEIEVIVALVGKYYQDSSFKILTPYDAQRNAIEAALQTNNLPWKDRVFNVDSFQGQEDDIILISLVKTKQLGFLNELRRSNVMLTRLKKAMIIVTQRMFLDTIAFKTLIGRMAHVFRMLTPDSWIDADQVLSGEANMPERVVANTEVYASDAANLGQYGLDWNATVINGERAQAKSSKPAWSQDNGPPRPKSDDEESVVEPGRLDFDSAEFEITPIEIETEEEAANRPKTDWAADEQEDGLPALAEQWILDAQARANESRAVEDDEEPAEASKPETPEEIDDGLMAEGEDNVGQGDAEEDPNNFPRYPPGLGPADLPPVPPGLANPLTVELTPEEILRNLPPLPRAPYGEQDDLDGDEVRRKPPRLDLIWSVPGEEEDEDDEEQEYSDDSETIAKRRRRAFASGLSWDPDRVPAAVGWEDTVPGRPASAAEDEPSAQSSAAVESNANGNASSSAKKPKQAAASTNGRPQAASGWDDSVPPRGTDEYLAGLWDGTIVYDGPPRANKHVIPGLPSSVKAAASDPTKKAKRGKKKTNIV